MKPFWKQSVNTDDANTPKPHWWKWAIALSASLGAVLEIVDTSIVNVALTDMQGNLGATLSEVGWVVTGYAIANVVIIPLSAWLGEYFGKKRYFIFSLIGFVLSSVLCGFASTLPMLIAARVLQGLAGGGLLAKAQAILFETFPKEEQPMAQAVFGLGVIAGPALGPVLGGFLTDTIGWRWIFFINVPIGLLAVIAAAVFFPPDRHNADMNRRVDWLGIFFLVVGLAAFQTFLEEGQQEDWFASRLIITMATLTVVGLILFIWQEMTIDYPAVNLRVFRYRSLVAGSLFSMLLGMGLYGALFAVPIFAQSILQFTATKTGLLLLPGALASGVTMIVMGRLVKFLDPRIFIGLGATLMAVNMFDLAHINPGTSADSLFWPLIFRGVATVMLYLPLSLSTFGPIPKKDMAAASGVYNLTRQIGGGIGIAAITTLLAQRENFHRSILDDRVTAFNQIAQERVQMLTASFQQQGAALNVAQQKAFAVVNGWLNLQASVLSFGDIFFVVGVAFASSLLLLFFMGNASSSEEPMDVH